MRGSCVARVALPPLAAVRDRKTIAGHGEIVDQLTRGGVINDGADRRGDFLRFAFAARAIAAFAVTAALGFMFGVETEMEQRVVVLAGDEDDVPTTSAV